MPLSRPFKRGHGKRISGKVDKFHKWSRTAAMIDVYYKRFLSFAQEDIMRPIEINKASLRTTLRRWSVVGLTLLVLILALTGCATETPSTLDPASDSAGEIASLFYLVLVIAVVVFVLVEGLLIYAVFRYRRREDEDEEPEQIHGNATLEILWTVIPAIIMVVLFVLTLRTLQAQTQTPEDAYVIRVYGQQWFWRFEYVEEGVFTTDQLYIPVDRPVVFQIESTDVIHSFWIPQLGGKRDAVPGRTNEMWIEANTEGTYLGECAEFCGREHYAMLFDVHVMSEDEFADTLQGIIDAQDDVLCPDQAPCEEVIDVTSLPEGTASEGEAQYTELNCNSCHSLDGAVLVGPSFQGLGGRAEGRSEEESAQQYLAHSILRPHDFLVPGFQPVMPEIFGQELTPDELADLIAFLMEQ